MLGYDVHCYRQDVPGRTQPATWDTAQGASDSGHHDCVAWWSAECGVTQALMDALPPDSIVNIGGNGYPSYMTARFAPLLALLRNEPPNYKRLDGKGQIYDDIANACSDDEWLILELWDQS